MAEWRDEQLGSLVSFEYGSALRAESRTGHGFNVYGSNGVVGHHDSALVAGPGIIIGRKGSVGALHWSEDDFWPIDTTYWAKPKADLDLRWIREALDMAGLASLDSSTGVPGLNRYDAYERWVPVPPLEEQRRIAEILDTIDETIQATERVIAKQRVILAGLQESLLEVDDGATRTTVGDLVSGHWPGEWGEAIPSVGSREVIVLRATNLDDYGVDYSTGARRFVSGLKVAEKRLMDGDLLVEAAGGGPGVPVGRVRRFGQPADDMPYLTSNFFRALRPKAGVNPDYLFWMLDLEYRKPSIWSCQQQTTGIINLQVRDYLRRPVIYHHRSQGSIARTLNAALRAVEVERQQLQKLRETRSGLAADLLSGRVRTVAA